MVTKWRNFTTRTAVKLVSFLLVLVLCFVILNRLNACVLRANDTQISPDIVLTDIESNRYFYDSNMHNMFYYASTILTYVNEASIRVGEHLQWQIDTERWNDDVVTYDYKLSSLNKNSVYAWLNGETDTPEKRTELEQSAIRMQLDEFRTAKKTLETATGLLFCIRDENGLVLMSNSNGSAEFFRSQPVYIISGDGERLVSSHPGSYYNQLEDGMIVYLAFPSDIVSEKNSEYTAIKNSYIIDLSVAAVAAVLMMVLLVILFAGAGRRADSAGVQFLSIDRPFLDISLALVAIWTALACYGVYEFGWVIWQYNNPSAMNALLAAFVVVILPPALLWLFSLVKRMKAGRFWRHTLIWFIPSRCVRLIKSLWAGFPLTAKVIAISAASFCILIYMAAIGMSIHYSGGYFAIFSVILLTAVIAYLLLRYAHRIYKLEQGAKATSQGDYETEISVGRGELGRIASSINNISAGINDAVNERMKSERLKTELITNVSHDIRTPLTSIITYTDLLKSEGLSCEKAPEYLDVLIQKSQRLKTLTDELFEAAKAATGNIDVNITKLDLVSLINQVLGELDSSITASGLDLRVKLPEQLYVMADGKLMWRVFENLLTNVFKYSQPGSRVYLDTERENLTVRVDIKNISATELNVDPSELTERFKRGDESRADGGSGLGLSIVQSFMAAQGGRLALSIDGDLFKASVHLPLA